MIKRLFFLFLILLFACDLSAARRKRFSSEENAIPEEQRMGVVHKIKTTDFGKNRCKKPRFQGAFKVGLCIVEFPDTVKADVDEVVRRQTEGVEAYYKRYTFGQCWPEFVVGGVYKESKPLGYYTGTSLHHYFSSSGDSQDNLATLVGDLKTRAFANMNAAFKRCPVKALVIMTRRAPLSVLETIPQLRKAYPVTTFNENQSADEILYEGMKERYTVDRLEQRYYPANEIRWGDPLWPNSSVVLHAEGGSGTMIHELGHVLGAPDYYHAPRVKDGVPGTPTCGGGPTGPLYCRYRYCGLVDDAAYPMVTTERTITLAPRWSENKDNILGVFIPTVHPHYLLHLEYEPIPVAATGDAETRVGRYGTGYSANGGVLAYYINVTKGDPYMGHPDLAYTYRENDPDLKGLTHQFVYFHEGDTFDAESNPANILPNRIPTGVEIEFGEQNEAGATVRIKPPVTRLSSKAYRQSLLPIVVLDEVDEALLLPTSLEAKVRVQFRGEPLLTEYGFVVGERPNPIVGKDKTFSLFHEERHAGRLLGIPAAGKKVYVRAYGKNALGVRYSEQMVVTLPKTVDEVHPLLDSSHGSIHDSNAFAHHGTARRYKEGYLLGASPYLSLVKLLLYGRAPLDKTKPKNLSFDIEKINICPQCPKLYPYARLADYHRAFDYCHALASASQLDATVFSEKFDKTFAKIFGLKYTGDKRNPPDIVKVDDESILKEEKRIFDSLVKGIPVMCIRQPKPHSSYSPALNTCLIDGYRKNEESGEAEVHIVFMEGYDVQKPKVRDQIETRRTGWWPLPILVDASLDARIVYWTRRFLSKKPGRR